MSDLPAASPSSPEHSRPERIVSGGQTGVDRAALDAAIALGIDHGGWCPRGRLAEDGVVPSRYQVEELASPEYTVRTQQNVIDSDATMILHEGRLKGGSLLTYRIARRLDKPRLLVALDQDWSPGEARLWLDQQRPRVLNVAGPRESSRPGIYDRALQALLRILEGPPRADGDDS